MRDLAGFIWVNMERECGPLKDYLGPIWDEWQAREVIPGNAPWPTPCGCRVIESGAR